MSRILVTGSGGQLGRELVLLAEARGHAVARLGRHEPEPCDVTDAEALRRRVNAFGPELVIHAAAWTAVDDCEADPERAHLVNAGGTANVAAAAEAVGAHVVYVSTDYVFDGSKVGPYVESDPPAPRSAYGRSKLAGEQALDPRHTVARTSWVSGAHGPNVVRTILRVAAERPELRFVDDQVGNPTFTADLAPALLDLGLDRAAGTWHVTNQGTVSWHGFARSVLAAAGLDPDRVVPIATADLDPPRPAPRPANSALDGAALRAAGRPPLRDFHEPLAELVAAIAPEAGPRPARP
ncbi:dTDP-4-dehydrorhamnose reductase [Aquihabitans sp. G128]|uniref:dTDP-4-dehydrorhamnose reductase n=1 Tax=Aquihabitans sp. G128 TaxID=2849779 RepID=UPI001C247A3E|nr:dTDP-4-dehydrorhamnose reductase [Aquihabitans sp. G128]QXC61479.1 dTDP-4-dehydrorhamnose reductase [Aquihabitans sp. G128]